MHGLALISLAACGFAAAAALPTSSRGTLFPAVIGHRGIPSVYPENTLISFQAALDAGVDGIESDLHWTADNPPQLVLLHDDTLERTTNCTGFVWNYTLAQLASCNANYASVFGDKFGFQPIPTFESIVALVAKKQVGFVLDLKADGHYAAAVCPILSKYGATDLAVFSAWSQDQIVDAAQNCPQAARQFLNESALPVWATHRQNGVDGFSLELQYLSPEFMKQAKAALFQVNAWTVDSDDDIETAINLGVTAILTNVAPNVIKAVDGRIQQSMQYANPGDNGKFSGGAVAGAAIGSALGGGLVSAFLTLFLFKRGSFGVKTSVGATAVKAEGGFYSPVPAA